MNAPVSLKWTVAHALVHAAPGLPGFRNKTRTFVIQKYANRVSRGSLSKFVFRRVNCAFFGVVSLIIFACQVLNIEFLGSLPPAATVKSNSADLATLRSTHPFPADSIQINRASSAFWRALFIHSVASAALASKMPCSEVTDAVSPQKRCKSDAVNGHEELKVLKFAKLTENATTPSRGSNRAAGFDLYRWLDPEPLADQRCVSVFCSCMLFCTLRFMQNTRLQCFPLFSFLISVFLTCRKHLHWQYIVCTWWTVLRAHACCCARG